MNIAIFAKFILNGLEAGSLYALLALGLSLIYGVLRFVNLAHGQFALIGAFAFYSFYVSLGWPLIPSFIAALVILAAATLLIERFLFRPVRDAPGFIALIMSIGLGIFLSNLLLLLYGGYARSLSNDTTSHVLFSDIIRITNVQIVILIASVVLMLGLWFFLQYTKMGMAIRAVSENKETAAILGIPVNRVISMTFLIAMLIAGTAGILAAFDGNLHPDLGHFLTVKSFSAVILGGIGSIPGAVLGGYIIGLAENVLIAIPFGSYYIPSGYKDAIAFVVLILLLYIKPSGIFGARREELTKK